MVILLTAVMLSASPALTAMMVVSVAAVMIVQPVLQQARAGRQAARATATAGQGPAGG